MILYIPALRKEAKAIVERIAHDQPRATHEPRRAGCILCGHPGGAGEKQSGQRGQLASKLRPGADPRPSAGWTHPPESVQRTPDHRLPPALGAGIVRDQRHGSGLSSAASGAALRAQGGALPAGGAENRRHGQRLPPPCGTAYAPCAGTAFPGCGTPCTISSARR